MNTKKVLSIVLVLAVICSMGILAACGNKAEEATTASTTAAVKETLVMATNASFPPYEYIENGKIIGIDAEIAQAIADKLGMTLQIEDIEFGSIIAGVQTGKYNMGMAGMTVNEKRLQSVNFTTSYAKGVQVVIVKENSKIKTLDDLTGKKIGVQQDTTGDIYASDTVENGGFGEANVTSYKNGAEAVSALNTGKIDAVIIDNEPAKAYVAANKGLKILDTNYVTEDYAICVSKENPELLAKINKALDELIADGTVQTIVNKYIKA